jgi:hypothetical protein
MRTDGNRLHALPRLLEVSISFRLIVIALIILVRACVVPQCSTNGFANWSALQLRRCVSQSYVDVLTQRRRGASRSGFRSLIRRRVRRLLRHITAFNASLVCQVDSRIGFGVQTNFGSHDAFCTSGTSP